MKLFLLIYDRGERRLLRLAEYAPADRARASADRVKAELAAAQAHRDQEIVLFEAESLDALKRTHGSYFYTVQELGEKLRKLAS